MFPRSARIPLSANWLSDPEIILTLVAVAAEDPRTVHVISLEPELSFECIYTSEVGADMGPVG